jgi:hypothetical protein
MVTQHVGAVRSATRKQFSAYVNLDGHDTACRMDTGSDCNVMSYKTCCQILQDGEPKLHKSRAKLKFYDGSTMLPNGKRSFDCKYKNQQLQLEFGMVKADQQPLLSAALGMLTVNVDINNIKASTRDDVTMEGLTETYTDVFGGLGCLPGEYKINIDEMIKPVKNAPRKVAVAIKPQLKAKLADLESKQIIKKVTEPTKWISSMVLVKKPNKLRICLDPKPLNTAINRAHYMMPTVEDILPKLTNARVFSVLDAKDGFWQIKLDNDSSHLTTFSTPYGRYRWLRMPFGISSAPEEFQRRQHEIVEDLHGVEVIADDYLIYGSGSTDEEASADHDKNLIRFMERARKVNLKINQQKMKFKMKSVSYMGHLITAGGLQASPEKIRAIIDLPMPENKKAVQRLLGCVRYLAKFLPRLSQVAEPLRRLTDKDAHWEWMEHHQDALDELKQLLTEAPVLQYYDVNKEVTIQCDASESGLEATLLQEQKPVSFASRALTSAERNYAQIEKELLGIVFACERFDDYIYARNVTVHTDHKPLIAIQKKPICKMPKRLQRMFLRLQKYHLDIQYLPGTKLYIADFLSRAYLPESTKQQENIPEYQILKIQREQQLYEEIESINQMEYLRISDATSIQLQKETQTDTTLQTLKSVVLQGWPEDRSEVPANVKEYFSCKEDITLQNGVLYRGMQVIVPKALQANMMSKLHTSHLGVEATLRRARDVLYWPGMTGQIKDMIAKCSACNIYQDKQRAEPMMSYEIPTRPWSLVSQDLFSYRGEDYVPDNSRPLQRFLGAR